MNPKARGTAYILISAVAFGLMPLLALKIYGCGGNSLFLSLCRFAFSIPPLYFMARKEKVAKHPHLEGSFFAIAAVYILTPLLLFVSYSYIASI